MHFDTK